MRRSEAASQWHIGSRIRGPACTFCRGQFGKVKVQVFRRELRSNFMRLRWASKSQFYCTEQMTALVSGCDAFCVACVWGLKSSVERVVNHSLPHFFESETEGYFFVKATKL